MGKILEPGGKAWVQKQLTRICYGFDECSYFAYDSGCKIQKMDDLFYNSLENMPVNCFVCVPHNCFVPLLQI